MAVEVEYAVSVAVDKGEMRKRMKVLGELVINEMRKLALDMGLVQTSDYANGFFATARGDNVILFENRVSYAEALEFGTYSYASQYGESRFPDSPDPKKKDLPRDIAKRFPKGMQPFAVMRRVLFNSVLMNKLINQAFA